MLDDVRSSPTITLLHRVSWRAEKLLRQRGKFETMLWTTQGSDGQRECFETECRSAEATDDELLAALVAELRADFARDGIVRFALAYPGWRVSFTPGPLRKPSESERVEVLAFEAHNADDVHIGCHREVIRVRGRPPTLGCMSTFERLGSGRYNNLLCCEPVQAIPAVSSLPAGAPQSVVG